MTYIELMNRFWNLNNEHFFTSYETQLYFYLLNTCNHTGWKKSFVKPNKIICYECSISEKTLISLRNRLKQIGLIDFISGGKNKRDYTTYTILGLPLGCSTVSPTVSPLDTVDIYNNISNKTKTKTKEKEKEKEKEKPDAANAATIANRKDKFYQSLVPFVEKYPKEMIREFFDYWSELTRSGVKMRFELQKTWELSLRLSTWARRDKEFTGNKSNESEQPEIVRID
jgi:hypothetical protein